MTSSDFRVADRRLLLRWRIIKDGVADLKWRTEGVDDWIEYYWTLLLSKPNTLFFILLTPLFSRLGIQHGSSWCDVGASATAGKSSRDTGR